jgi:predicted esterase
VEGGDKKVVRRGHAMRHGYITIAVNWQKPHQYEYEYSSREHLAVLTCLRDACRRLSIDTDRVFLTGHDIGGEAAWDMAQAHPDLWAGAMPFVPRFEEEQKYIAFYWENAEYLPMYYVAGELDGRTIAQNALVWNKYLRLRRFDATLVEFQGRGHEPFHDEIITLFEWMALKRRSGPPKEFLCLTLRPWDNFFWWLECAEFPDSLMVYPTDWSRGRITPAKVEGKIQNDNRLSVETAAGRTTIWLAPDFVDFSKPIRVSLNNRSLPTRETSVKPDPYVLLEDVRTRADRQRPFWAKIDVP